MANLFRELIAELKTGPGVFIHGPEFWLALPWIFWAILIVIGGKRK